jgi:hypothetical protein
MGGSSSRVEYRTQIEYRESPGDAELIRQQQSQLESRTAQFEEFQREAIRKENELRDEIAKNEQALIRLKAMANVDKTQFLELKQWFEDNKIQMGKTVDYGIVGGKGEGKSTFKWMKGWGDKPTRNSAGIMEGAVALEYSTVFEAGREVSIVEAIGLRAINYDSFIKLMALFILKGRPRTLLFITKTDRLYSLAEFLSNMMVSTYHIVSFRDPSVVTCAWLPSMIRYEDLYNIESMENIQARLPYCVATHHGTRLRELDSFFMYKGFMMSTYIEVPEWEDYISDESPKTSLYYFILLHIRWYLEQFDGKYDDAELKFMNTLEKVGRPAGEI